MRIEYGPAVLVESEEPDLVTLLFNQLIRMRVSRFNIVDAGEFALIVFRHAEEADRWCRRHGHEIVERRARYYPDKTILGD